MVTEKERKAGYNLKYQVNQVLTIIKIGKKVGPLGFLLHQNHTICF